MILQIDKEIRKKKRIKWIVLLGIVFYLYVVLCIFHTVAIKKENKRLSYASAINLSFSRVFTDPTAIFPIDMNVVYIVCALTAGGICFGAMAIADKGLRKHDNPDTVNGEAHLMTAKELEDYNLRFASPIGKPETDGANNMIISKDIKLAIDNRGTRRNCNILCIGGSGAGKSRFFASPNILQYNCNFVITDPSGEMLRDYGKALEDVGYEVKVFNLSDVYRSNRYNPFHYIKEEKDIFTLVNTFMKNTTPSDQKSGDVFWEKSEQLLITSLVTYLWHCYPEEEQTFANVVNLLGKASVDENNADAKSELDVLFEDLEREDPTNLAVKQYKKFKLGAGKTLKSILISVGVRLQSFDLTDMQYLTSADDFEFERFSDTKQAVFVIIPTADTTFNFIVSMLYSQLFDSLYRYAEKRAEYGWIASIDELTNIKVIQASNKKESAAAKKKLESFVEEIKKGVVIKHDKVKSLYKVYTKSTNELIGWRGSKEDMKSFVAQLKKITIKKGSVRCPNHVRLILDEFANSVTRSTPKTVGITDKSVA